MNSRHTWQRINLTTNGEEIHFHDKCKICGCTREKWQENFKWFIKYVKNGKANLGHTPSCDKLFHSVKKKLAHANT